MKNNRIHKMVIAALLCAIGIIIPMFSPLQIRLEPASFTLASHVAIMIAMFVSPSVAIGVSLGTTIGFLMGGFPIVIVARALTHVIWAGIGAYVLKSKPQITQKMSSLLMFMLMVSLIHGLCELIIVCPFYFGNNLGTGYYAKGFVFAVVGLVGIGSVIHSMVDFAISSIIQKVLLKNKSIRSICIVKEIL